MRLIFSSLVFALSGSLSTAFACMCGATSVCDAYSQASAVVIAEMVDYRPMKISMDRIFVGGEASEFETGQEVSLKIHHWYKGGTAKIIKLAQPNSGCDWSFDNSQRNKRYLFYLKYNKKYRDYSVVSCGRSSELVKRGDDLKWLNALPGALRRTRISGTSRLNDDSNTFPPVSGVLIVVDGGRTKFSLETNEIGLYEKWDVPPGKYRISAYASSSLRLSWTTSVPNDWLYFWSDGESDPKALDVTIESSRCGGVDFMFERK